MKLMHNLAKWMLPVAAFTLLALGFASCSDDDEQAPDPWEWDGRELNKQFTDLVGYISYHPNNKGQQLCFTPSEPNDFWEDLDDPIMSRFVILDPTDEIRACQGKKVVISGSGCHPYLAGTENIDGFVLGRIRIDNIVLYDNWERPVPPRDPINRVAHLVINTDGGQAITDKKNYVACQITMESDVEGWDFADVKAGIRGRGNSTWLWYPKKPYRIKFDKKHDMLGLDAAKSWVLLANYRDPTDLMNAYVFELGQLMGIPFTNHNRYVTLTLNGVDLGLYQLTEQVQVNKARVNVDEKNGYLLSLDLDDGPELAPQETDNFFSDVYRLPVCVKNPEDITAEAKDQVRADLAVLENAIRTSSYAEVKSMLDVTSMIDYLLIQELVYNVEMDAPRSVYINRDAAPGSLWTFGPLWDFDAGYDFDWGDMYTGHGYFRDFRELVYGTNPYTHDGTKYSVPNFFTDLFRHAEFKAEYRARWEVMKSHLDEAWNLTEAYVDADVWTMEDEMWPIEGMTSFRQITAMKRWLTERASYLDNVIANY